MPDRQLAWWLKGLRVISLYRPNLQEWLVWRIGLVTWIGEVAILRLQRSGVIWLAGRRYLRETELGCTRDMRAR